MNEQFWSQHEQKVKRTVRAIATLLVLAMMGLLLPFVDALRPAGESVATWWQRAGAPVAVFAFLAQNKFQYLGALLTPGSFTSAEMESLRKAYRRTHQIGLSSAIVLDLRRNFAASQAVSLASILSESIPVENGRFWLAPWPALIRIVRGS